MLTDGARVGRTTRTGALSAAAPPKRLEEASEGKKMHHNHHTKKQAKGSFVHV